MLGVLAVRLRQLKIVARKEPRRAAAHLMPLQWLKALSLLTKRKQPIKTVFGFFRALAGLGGFPRRKGDGEPGWQTIWSGLETLLPCLRGADALGRKLG